MSPRAIRDLDDLPCNIQEIAVEAIDNLEEKPRSWFLENSKKMEGYKNRYRIKLGLGDYRIIFKFASEAYIVVILLIGHRKDIYKKLKRLD